MELHLFANLPWNCILNMLEGLDVIWKNGALKKICKNGALKAAHSFKRNLE